MGLFVLDLGPGGKVTRAVQFATDDVIDIRWVNEDRLLFSLVDLSGADGRPHGLPGLFTVNADGTGMRTLIMRTAHRGGERDYTVLDWNHDLRFVPRPRPDADNEEVLLTEYTHNKKSLMWLNTRTGTTRHLNVKAPDHNIQWLLDPRGEPRATLTRKDDRVQAYWLPPGSSHWEQLFDTPVLAQPYKLHDIDSSGTLYVTHVPKGSTHAVLTRYDPKAKAPAEPALVRTPGFDFAGHLLMDGDSMLGVRATADSETTVSVDKRMVRFQQEVDKRVPGHINRIHCRRCGEPDMVAIVNSFNDHEPGKLTLYQAQPPAGGARWQSIGRFREAVVPNQMAGLDFQTIKARDGRDLPVWITRADDAKGPLPAVVLVHGGPWRRGLTWGWSPWGQFLASRGYVVIEPEFRGSTGFGDDHWRAGFKQWGQAMQDDVTDALRWAQKQGLASDRACIIGGSYGGYSTLMGLARDPELYRCGVAWMAVSDLALLVEGSWWVPDDGATARKFTVPETIGDAKQDAAMIAANSPVNLASRIQAPLLLMHGDKDLRVPIAHARRLRDALTAARHPPEWVNYPDEGHGFSRRENQLDLVRRVEGFLARHLQP
jgi:acetyl esterase/lipase